MLIKLAGQMAASDQPFGKISGVPVTVLAVDVEFGALVLTDPPSDIGGFPRTG